MPSLFAESQVRVFYELLCADRLSERVGSYFRPDAVYHQINTDMKVQGYRQILWIMAGWRASLADIKLGEIQMVLSRTETTRVFGASHCFHVNYMLAGEYRGTFLGAQGMPPARRQAVNLPISEILWVDRAGLILRQANTINVAALQ